MKINSIIVGTLFSICMSPASFASEKSWGFHYYGKIDKKYYGNTALIKKVGTPDMTLETIINLAKKELGTTQIFQCIIHDGNCYDDDEKADREPCTGEVYRIEILKTDNVNPEGTSWFNICHVGTNTSSTRSCDDV